MRGATSSLLGAREEFCHGEIGVAYRERLKEWSSELREGAILTLAYGGPPARLEPRQKRGSLPTLETRARAEPQIAYLLASTGAGEAFLALEQRRPKREAAELARAVTP